MVGTAVEVGGGIPFGRRTALSASLLLLTSQVACRQKVSSVDVG